jgi:hypothetical protein
MLCIQLVIDATFLSQSFHWQYHIKMPSGSSEEYDSDESGSAEDWDEDFRSRTQGSGFDEPGAGEVFVEGERA